MSVSFLIEENEGIRKFLEGDDSYVPISEFKYLHERPLMRDTFLAQIDTLVARVAKKISEGNIKKGVPIDNLMKLVIALGQHLGQEQLTDSIVTEILKTLREIYNLALVLDKQFK